MLQINFVTFHFLRKLDDKKSVQFFLTHKEITSAFGGVFSVMFTAEKYPVELVSEEVDVSVIGKLPSDSDFISEI